MTELVVPDARWHVSWARTMRELLDEVIGFLARRHGPTPWLLEGGHIGCSVRPGSRHRGHASRALALALVRAADLGLERVLHTCDEENLASRRTIEGNGVVYGDTRNGRQRYWIDLPG
jgi:predicted acetyltransferase